MGRTPTVPGGGHSPHLSGGHDPNPADGHGHADETPVSVQDMPSWKDTPFPDMPPWAKHHHGSRKPCMAKGRDARKAHASGPLRAGRPRPEDSPFPGRAMGIDVRPRIGPREMALWRMGRRDRGTIAGWKGSRTKPACFPAS